MEFQEGLMRVMIQKPREKQRQSRRTKKQTEKTKNSETETTNITKSVRRWKLFSKSPSSSNKIQSKPDPPSEFLCPITGSLMAEPVIVSSGHTFERACVEACKALELTPTLVDSSTPDFSSVISNLALRSAIASWCRESSVDPPTPLDTVSAAKLVRNFMAKNSSSTELSLRQPSSSFSSVESVQLHSVMPVSVPIPLPEKIPNPEFLEEEEDLLAKLKSQQVFEAEEGLVSLRQISRTREESRARLCSYRLLAALRSLIPSRYTGIQVNAVAALVNLSLEKSNKKKIVRSGIVPPLIDVLKSGSLEAQEHAAGAIFSLALEDDNKTAIGVLGALQPLIHLLRAESERTRQDAVLALYHLSLVQTNRSKLVKMGSVPVLLNMAKAGHLTGRILTVLGNLGSGLDGRVAMLDSGAVECMVVTMIGGSRAVGEGCIAVLYTLSHGGLRFRALANEAKLVEAVKTAEETMGSGWSERTRKKAKAVLEATQQRENDVVSEDVNWEELLGEAFERQSRSSISGL